MFARDGYEILSIAGNIPANLNTYDSLPLDEYSPSKTRFRRFSQYKLTSSDVGYAVVPLPHRPFLQLSDYNKLIGGVKRDFPPLAIDPTDLIVLGASRLVLPAGKEWQINCHQIRVVADKGRRGVPVPEGPHRDGFDYLMLSCFAREGVVGGVTELMPIGGGKPFFATTLQPGQAILIDDTKMFHNVTELEVAAGDSGHRDILIAAFLDWDRRKYGEEYEKRALGQ